MHIFYFIFVNTNLTHIKTWTRPSWWKGHILFLDILKIVWHFFCHHIICNIKWLYSNCFFCSCLLVSNDYNRQAACNIPPSYMFYLHLKGKFGGSNFAFQHFIKSLAKMYKEGDIIFITDCYLLMRESLNVCS